LQIEAHPHHKHAGGEDNVVASDAPDVSAVLDEIESLVLLP
jgi:hypothetical protein